LHPGDDLRQEIASTLPVALRSTQNRLPSGSAIVTQPVPGRHEPGDHVVAEGTAVGSALLAKKSWITCLTALFHWLPASQSCCRRRSPRRRRVRPGRPTAGVRHGAEGSLNSVWKASKPWRCSTRRRAAVRGPKPWRWSKLGEPSQQRVHLALVGRVLDRYSSTVKRYQSVDDYRMDAFGSEKR
jgi:hypothetical protein